MKQILNTERNDRHNVLVKRSYLSLQHIERYFFACNYLKPGDLVLDIACGTAYGTAILLENGCNVIGADIDRSHIENLKQALNYENFEQADITALPFRSNKFDAVVCFETIEHVADGNKVLKELKRVLRSGGVIVCSTPNIRYTDHPVWHVKEYTPKEFYGLASNYFDNIEYFAQYITHFDLIRDISKRFIRKTAKRILAQSSILEKIKESVKCKLNKHKKVNFTNQSMQDMINNIKKIRRDSFHSVKPFAGENRLRIMIVTGRKSITEHSDSNQKLL